MKEIDEILKRLYEMSQHDYKPEEAKQAILTAVLGIELPSRYRTAEERRQIDEYTKKIKELFKEG